jgi:hypothetical protein
VSNESYLREICDELSTIPQRVALQAASTIFEQVVQQTRVDSGQAAMNWQFIIYEGDPNVLPEEIMWGFGDTPPMSPVGYKWSYMDNSAAVYQAQYENMLDKLASAPAEFDGIMIANPISPGFAGFEPMTPNDYFYADNAFAGLNYEGVVQSAIEEAEADASQHYGKNNA